MRDNPSDVAFTPAVKAIQERKGSRRAYARMERGEGWRTAVTPDLAEYLAELDMFYLGTATADGRPYIQYRGGPPGFLKVLDRGHSPSPTSAAIASSSPSATSPKTRGRSSS